MKIFLIIFLSFYLTREAGLVGKEKMCQFSSHIFFFLSMAKQIIINLPFIFSSVKALNSLVNQVRTISIGAVDRRYYQILKSYNLQFTFFFHFRQYSLFFAQIYSTRNLRSKWHFIHFFSIVLFATLPCH